MKAPVDFSNERELLGAFVWVTRAGAGMPFGSVPIGWYQQHQTAALDTLYREACRVLWPDLRLGDEPCPMARAEFRETHGGIEAPRFKFSWKRSKHEFSRQFPHCNRIWVKALNGPNAGQMRELGSAGDFYEKADRLARV